VVTLKVDKKNHWRKETRQQEQKKEKHKNYWLQAITFYCTYYYQCIFVIHLHTFLFVLHRSLDG